MSTACRPRLVIGGGNDFGTVTASSERTGSVSGCGWPVGSELMRCGSKRFQTNQTSNGKHLRRQVLDTIFHADVGGPK
ncbi:hypothetical protein ZHAS_00021122 [Anopheles sinensis]|uniref:Uncharacterized protein n=1 Tax=Anopheles sinensis TaxID=74873 RepID=A0A084WRK6_ANOSI|nr:hypothetical protein ZHAS_00021122 [Anopheles sinensis]